MYFATQCYACLCLNYHIADKHEASTHCVSLALGIYFVIIILLRDYQFLSYFFQNSKKQDNPRETHKRNNETQEKQKRNKRN